METPCCSISISLVSPQNRQPTVTEQRLVAIKYPAVVRPAVCEDIQRLAEIARRRLRRRTNEPENAAHLDWLSRDRTLKHATQNVADMALLKKQQQASHLVQNDLPLRQFAFAKHSSTFFQGIIGGKQLGDSQSSITVPILSRL